MNDAYTPPPLNLTREDLVAWWCYESANRRAKAQYKAMPTTLGHAATDPHLHSSKED